MAGKIHRIVQFVEAKTSAFGVSRLIMLTGVPVRSFQAGSVDDADVLRKLSVALPQLLSREDLDELDREVGS